MKISVPARAAACAVVVLLATGSVVMAVGGPDGSTTASGPTSTATPDVPRPEAAPRPGTTLHGSGATGGSSPQVGAPTPGGLPSGSSDDTSVRTHRTTPVVPWSPTTGPTTVPSPMASGESTPQPSASPTPEPSDSSTEPAPEPSPDPDPPLLDGLVELLTL